MMLDIQDIPDVQNIINLAKDERLMLRLLTWEDYNNNWNWKTKIAIIRSNTVPEKKYIDICEDIQNRLELLGFHSVEWKKAYINYPLFYESRIPQILGPIYQLFPRPIEWLYHKYHTMTIKEEMMYFYMKVDTDENTRKALRRIIPNEPVRRI